jgi:hypothetical protein
VGELEKAADLPARLKAEIEQFFLGAIFTDKRAKVTGWGGPKAINPGGSNRAAEAASQIPYYLSGR